MPEFETSVEISNTNQFNLFLKNYVTSEGAGSHNVLYHDQQLLSIARNQVSFYANNYFE